MRIKKYFKKQSYTKNTDPKKGVKGYIITSSHMLYTVLYSIVG